MLALLIPGPHKVKNMDVYLEPLIDELQILWHGIHVHDVSCPIGMRYAEVKEILMWMMHDYPGYSECSGYCNAYLCNARSFMLMACVMINCVILHHYKV